MTPEDDFPTDDEWRQRIYEAIDTKADPDNTFIWRVQEMLDMRYGKEATKNLREAVLKWLRKEVP